MVRDFFCVSTQLIIILNHIGASAVLSRYKGLYMVYKLKRDWEDK